MAQPFEKDFQKSSVKEGGKAKQAYSNKSVPTPGTPGANVPKQKATTFPAFEDFNEPVDLPTPIESDFGPGFTHTAEKQGFSDEGVKEIPISPEWPDGKAGKGGKLQPIPVYIVKKQPDDE